MPVLPSPRIAADVPALLGGTMLFGGLDPAALEKLAAASRLRRYAKGETIFLQGERGDSLFLVVRGCVKVEVTSERGETMLLVTLRPPETFGEVALIDGGGRSASARAHEVTDLLEVGRPAVLELLAERPVLADALLRSVGGALRRLTEQTADLVFLDLHGRVAKLLLTTAEERGLLRGAASTHGEAFDLDLTQGDIARMVGGSRQSVNQILRSFEQRGIVQMYGRTVVIRRAELLRKLAR